MFKQYFYAIIFLFCSVSGWANEAFTLDTRDVRATMDKIFSYHVENKEISPLIIQRSFKLYIEHFDPEKIYLMREEVEPFLNLDVAAIDEVIGGYHRDQFFRYHCLNQTIQRAIYRHQHIQKKQIERLLKEEETPIRHTSHFYLNYPSTLQELEERNYNRLLLQVKIYMTHHCPLKRVTPALIQKILHHCDKKILAKERTYLENSEHMLALHILKSMTQSLDAHTGYYSPREAEDIRMSLKREFSGVGIALKEDCEGIFVSGLVEGAPAQKSGRINVGDMLIAVNSCEAEKSTFKQMVGLIKGKEGSKVTLSLRRGASDSDLFHVALTREKIVMCDERLSYSVEPYGAGIIGKIDIPSFYDNGGCVSVERDLKESINLLKSNGDLKGLILDFRKNSGGFLTQAVKVASLFIRRGVIIISKYSHREVSYVKRGEGKQFFDGPLVILISKASASATEIVAQALQDHGVAIIVGDKRSYGKGSMQHQTLTDEGAKAFFKVTVGRYYTASGCSPQIKGVQSDIVVPTRLFPYNIGEKYLPFPLASDCLREDLFHSIMGMQRVPYHAHAHCIVPYLKPRESMWRQMLPKLCINSKERIENDSNFQLFLKMKGRSHVKQRNHRSGYRNNFGADDLQLKESVEIVKDMIFLGEQKNRCVFLESKGG